MQLKLFAEPVKVQECDLKEEDIGVVEVQENEFNFEIKPYEIKTFKVQF